MDTSPPEQKIIDDEAPFEYKVPEYEDAIPMGKSMTILGGALVLIAGIIFMFMYKGPAVPEAPKDSLDFSKMKSAPKQQQGQVAGAQSYDLPSPPPKKSPTPKTTEAPTPTPTNPPESPTNTPAPTPTNAPEQTATPTQVPPTDTPTSSPTEDPEPQFSN